MGWLRRLLGQEGGDAPAPGGAGPAAGPAPAATAAVPAVAPAAGAAPPPVPFGQRRALVGRSGQVAGFELLLPAALERRAQAQDRVGDLPPQVAQCLALLAAARPLQAGGRAVLVSVPAPVLARPGVAGQLAPGTLLMPLGPPLDEALAATLRRRGVLLGRPDGPPAPAPAADFVLLRADAGGIDTLQLSTLRWRKAQPDLRLVAVGLAGVDELERMLGAGAWLAGGRLGGTPEPAAARPLQAAAHRVCALLSDLAQDRETRDVAAAVRADAALSYRLLRYANSAALGLPRSVETVEDAVALLGRNELVRWLQVMLMTVAGGRQASAAVQEDALARGRLLEALALRRGLDTPSVLFTVGLLSRLDSLLDQPLDAALASLRLSDEVRSALLQRQGPWAWYLTLADALEGDDEERLGRLAAPFGGLEAVLAEAETAWRWAATVSAGQREG